MSIVVSTTLAVALLGTAFAYYRGGAPERITAALIAGWFLADVGYHLVFGPSGFDAVDPVHLALDGVVLLGISWIALRANRMWPLWAAAAQLICYSGHVAVFIQPGGMPRAYWAMTQIPPFIQLLALTLGALAHSRRERRVGRYRSWRMETSSTA